MGYSRGLLNWSANFLQACRMELVKDFQGLEATLEFSWSHLEHSIDSVRHNTKEFLNNIICACKLLGGPGEAMLNLFLKQTLSLPAHKKARFSSLSCLIRSGSLDKILEINPRFREEILELVEEYALVGPITDLYENIIKADYRTDEAGVENWFKGTVRPLLAQLQTSDNLGASQLSRNLLNKCGKQNTGLVRLIFKEEEGLQGKLGLYCLRLGRQLGNPWNYLEHRKLIERSLESSDEEERLQALSLLVESLSSVERFHIFELNTIFKFTERNLSLPGASSRQVLLANLKKLLTRLRDGAAACLKKLTQPRLVTEHPELEKTVEAYSHFVPNLVRMLFRNLFPGANFARRGTVLQILTEVNLLLSLTTPPSWCNKGKLLLDSPGCSSLYSMLEDSYETNKEKALNILRDAPPHLLGLNNPERVREILSEIHELVVSCKPSCCMTAGYKMKLLLEAPAAAWVLADALGIRTAESGKVRFYAGVYMRNLLAQQLQGAENNLLEAAGDGPMYGVIYVLRCIYEDLVEDEVNEDWRRLTKDLITLGYTVSRVVASVVASNSPEGHLPMDNDIDAMKQLQRALERSLGSRDPPADRQLQPGKQETRASDKDFSIQCALLDKVVVSDVFSDEIVENILEGILEKAVNKDTPVLNHTQGHAVHPLDHTVHLEQELRKLDQSKDVNMEEEEEEEINLDLSEIGIVKAKEVSSQMLLLCAWRSVKELSLFLGDLCSRDSSATGSGLLSSDQVLEISSFLMDLLSQTKHRGAFEQAYVAFTKLCECLWRSSMTLPLEYMWPDSPFRIYVAIVSTEPDPSSPVFKGAMDKLIDLARDGSAEEKFRVHACNILRALFRDTRLADSVAGYVEDGIKVSINGFEASSWAERNSGTLLFSALITRIFGVKREKDSSELSGKNCLTGKVFFQRYPSLHSFLLSKLDRVQAISGTLHLQPALYPVLLILSRVFPSPSESMNNPFKLSSFIPCVDECSGSPILAIRKLAARALVPLIPPENLVEYGEKIVKKILNSALTTNQLHGFLLQLVQIKKSCPALSVSNPDLVDIMLRRNTCLLISAEYLILVNMQNDTNIENVEPLENILREKLFDERIELNSNLSSEERMTYNSDVGDASVDSNILEVSEKAEDMKVSNSDPSLSLWKPLFFKAAAEFLVNRSFVSAESGLLLKLFLHQEIEVRLVSLQLYKQYLVNGGESTLNMADIRNIIFCETKDTCISLLLEVCFYLPTLTYQQSDLTLVLSLVQVSQCDGILSAGVELAGKLITFLSSGPHVNGLEDPGALPRQKLDYAEILKRLSCVEQSSVVRYSVVKALKANTSLLVSNSRLDHEERIAFVVMWSCLIDFIHDDEDEIRNVCISINKNLTGEEFSEELTATSLINQCYRCVGKQWPAAVVLVVLGNILKYMLDTDQQGGADLDTDKAFDKGEMNSFRELEITCTTLLTPLTAFIQQLSPKLLHKAVTEQLPVNLLVILLPHLPGGVIVYSVQQLLEYCKVYDEWDDFDRRYLRQMVKALAPVSIVNPA
ncbi:thyroid adenoma-associated protein [Eurytemora carolleeae]|uniref:thyroid adenoma-associated protein n=1 Tax=Eurytemora carolleeae TaxID=1294199 RepID=UPI000C75746E|nr:thyroid adenoma-associated protein [Eurytemora carolleeae]|eukprot:XP_023344467.1 thyroid adenoma-associated protein-like [Eurytemora affinis]